MKKKFLSRKFILVVIYPVIYSLNNYFAFLPNEAMDQILILFSTYIGVEGGRDIILATKLNRK